MSTVAVACLAGFGFAARNSSRPLLFDASADRFLSQRSELWHRVAQRLAEVGDPKVFVTITVVVALALILVGDYRAAVAAVASVGLALILVEEVLKPFFDRRLPDLVGPTFPSGHSAVAVALAGAVAVAAGPSRPLGRLLGHFWRRLLVAIVAHRVGRHRAGHGRSVVSLPDRCGDRRGARPLHRRLHCDPGGRSRRPLLRSEARRAVPLTGEPSLSNRAAGGRYQSASVCL